MSSHLTLDELNGGLADVLGSPRDPGVLEAIVIRPATNERRSLRQCDLSPELGVHGDNWARGCWMKTPDGKPHPDVQVTMANSRAIALVAREKERWPLAGDNLFVDLDLSEGVLVAGQRLGIGSAVLEITGVPHNGCKKFAQRFGQDALKFVNSDVGKRMHLRGIYARIVQAGVVRVGDRITRI